MFFLASFFFFLRYMKKIVEFGGEGTEKGNKNNQQKIETNEPGETPTNSERSSYICVVSKNLKEKFFFLFLLGWQLINQRHLVEIGLEVCQLHPVLECRVAAPRDLLLRQQREEERNELIDIRCRQLHA